MKNLKNDKGITMIALAVTIVVILIITGITVKFGTDAIKMAKVETIITNMITIKAKSKGYAEEINAQIWDLEEGKKNENRTKLFQEKYSMELLTDDLSTKINGELINPSEYVAYYISKETLNIMGLDELANSSEDNKYAIVFNLSDFTKFDVIYLYGVEYEGNVYYNLSTLQDVFQND